MRRALFVSYSDLNSPFGGMRCFKYLEKIAIEKGYLIKWCGFAKDKKNNEHAIVERSPASIWKAFRLAIRVVSEIRQRPYHVIVIRSIFTSLAWYIAQKAKKYQPMARLIYYMLDPVPEAYLYLHRSGFRRLLAYIIRPLQLFAEKKLCKLCDYILVPGSKVEQIIRARNRIKGRILIVPSVHSVLKFSIPKQTHIQSIKKQYSLDGYKVILYSGRPQPHLRGIEKQLEVIARLRRRGYPVKYVITGRGNEAYFRQIAYELGISDSVVFTGILPENDLVALMYASDAIIIPPVDYLAPSKFYEAVYCGVPVICYDDCPDVAYLLRNEGIYYDGSEDDLERALIRLLTNIEKWRIKISCGPKVRLLKMIEETQKKLADFFNSL